MPIILDSYHKMLARNYLVQCKQAISEEDDERAYELCDDLIAIFCASRPEHHDEGPRAA